MKKGGILILAFSLTFSTLMLYGCKEPENEVETTDYSDPKNWAYFAEGDGKDADLFLIAPSVDTKDEYNMSLDDAETKENFLGALNMERGIYDDVTRMYAPYYRQIAIKDYSMEEDIEPYLEIAYSDVSEAFSYYLENENEGRPIVLAGFSQGADMCYRLLEEYFDDEELYGQLVAVYGLGWPLTEEMTEEFPQIRPAKSAYDTGVVISFDCEDPEVMDTFINPENKKALAINPLNWETDGTPADKSLNMGACFTDYSGSITSEVPQLCGAYIDDDRGVLKVPDLNPADYRPIVQGLPDGAYHVYDYQFFYRNLEKNVSDRVEAFENASKTFTYGVTHDDKFGGVYLDTTIDEFNALGFLYGDSVNVKFSNGYELEDIPYYSGFYTKPGEPLVLAYPGSPHIKVHINSGDDLWKTAKLDDKCTAEVSLCERGKYLDIQDARNIIYKNSRSEFPDDESFANFREVTAGDIKNGVLYRAASPCDDSYNRASYVDSLMKEAGVKCILNLADTKDDIQEYLSSEGFASDHFNELYQNKKVILSPVSANYISDDFKTTLAEGLIEMTKHEGPYLIHCTEGKDRTGFACILLEALCGASYDEIADDFMLSYQNYYNITEEADKVSYDIIKDSVMDPMIGAMIGDYNANVKKAKLEKSAREYLSSAGMSDKQIEELKKALT